MNTMYTKYDSLWTPDFFCNIYIILLREFWKLCSTFSAAFKDAICCHSTLLTLLFDKNLSFPPEYCSKKLPASKSNGQCPGAWSPEQKDDYAEDLTTRQHWCPSTVALGLLTLTAKVSHISSYRWLNLKRWLKFCRAVVTIPTMTRLRLAAPPSCLPHQPAHRARMPSHGIQPLEVQSHPPPHLNFTWLVIRFAPLISYVTLWCIADMQDARRKRLESGALSRPWMSRWIPSCWCQAEYVLH